MAQDAASAPSAPPATASATRPVREMSLARRLSFWGFAALTVLAVTFYVWWGVSFGVWIDNGVYAVFITLLLFGLAGMWLVLPDPPAPSAPGP